MEHKCVASINFHYLCESGEDESWEAHLIIYGEQHNLSELFARKRNILLLLS